LFAMGDSLRRCARGGRWGAPQSVDGRGDRYRALPEGANACCRRKGDGPKARNTLAGATAGGQIAWTRRNGAARAGRVNGQPNKMTTQDVNRGGSAHAEARTTTRARKTRRHRADEPGEAGRRCCAYHGPGHEIVKKPFATPFGGEYASNGARPLATEDVSPSLEIRRPCRQGA
jgi:hypothetical protein